MKVLAVLSLMFLGTAALAQTQIQFWHAMSGDNGTALEALVEGFNSSQSDFEVIATFKGTYDETLNLSVAAFRAGEQPHIMQSSEISALTMIESGVTVPVEELLSSRGYDVAWDDYVQALVRWYMTPAGELLSMPFNTSTPVLYWNKELVKAAGLDPEKGPATWDEFAAMVRKLGASGRCGHAVFGAGVAPWVHIENYSLSSNLPLATRENGYSGLDTELLVNTEPFVQHLNLIRSLLDEGVATYGGSGAGDLFTSGECATVFGSLGGIRSWPGVIDFAMGVAPVPVEATTEAPYAQIIGGATLWTFQGHTEQEYDGVAAFYDYLRQTPNQVAWHETTGYVPITNAAYAEAKAEGFYTQDPNQEVPLQAFDRPVALQGIRLGNYVQIRSILDENLEAIFSGDKSVQEALDDVTVRGNEALRRFEQQYGN